MVEQRNHNPSVVGSNPAAAKRNHPFQVTLRRVFYFKGLMVKSLFKKALIFFVVFFAIYAAYDFYNRQFRLQNIRFFAEEQASESLPSEEILHILKTVLAQPFYYLDRGKQSYVFASQDGQYVIKFFDIRAIDPTRRGPLASVDKVSLERKMARLVQGYRLAYKQNLEGSGLIFARVAIGPLAGLEATLFDRFGRHHQIDLSQVPFIIQKKAVPTRILISASLENGDLPRAKSYLGRIVGMYLSEYSRGLYDRDHNFMYNTGFVDDRPIRIDLGRLRADPSFQNPSVMAKDLHKIALRVREWSERHFPQYAEELYQAMLDKIPNVEVHEQ